MPRKRPGIHQFHVEMSEENWALLQRYCRGGIERISATAIVNLLINSYIDDCLRPRLLVQEIAAPDNIILDISKTIKKVAQHIEPDAF